MRHSVRNEECGRPPWEQVQRWAAIASAAIQRSGSEVLVTSGNTGVKWNSSRYEADRWSDVALRAQRDNPLARLAFC